MAGNTGTITFTVPLNAQLGTWFGLLQGTSNGQIQQIPISVVVTSQPKVKLQTVIGQISVSSVSGAGQAVDLTRLGSADWFSAGTSNKYRLLLRVSRPLRYCPQARWLGPNTRSQQRNGRWLVFTRSSQT